MIMDNMETIINMSSVSEHTTGHRQMKQAQTMTDREILTSYGFTVGKRDPRVNPAFAGEYMVSDENGWAIVGYDLNALMQEAITTFELPR